jgi:basic membrane lipoprotein Med (substrate-binding protein (PBP1-ABC) superfamily)
MARGAILMHVGFGAMCRDYVLDGVIMADAGRRWIWLGAVLALAACGGGSAPAAPAARARVYTSFQACLLTDARGISAAPAAQVWAGMEDASLKTGAKVSYLAVTGPATAANALPFLGSLLVRKCGVVVASGSPERAAALAVAPKYPGVRFALAGTAIQGPVAGGNVAVASAGQSGLRGRVAALIEADAGG